MKTTKRSKMLLSSIAMLLVALVALGSATFAWYTLNRHVEAQTAVVNAATPGGLDIRLDSTDSWSTTHSVDLSADGTFTPASLTFGTAGVATAYTTDADTASAYGKKSDAAVTDVKDNTNYYKVETFQVGNNSSVAQTVTMDVNVSEATASDNTFMNIAVLRKLSTETDYTVVGVYKSEGTTHKAINSSGTETYVYGTDGDIAAAATGIEQGSLGAGLIYDYMVVVYADGQNENCKTTGAATSNVTFSLDFDC